ncbi:MAG: tRNA 2-thiouridine(34) synthase MnmA [Candidatus Pacebacteria bacterium]|nr:tRNA 2-thiouridine(34) synthase MnmA [Candidatus Paceibacterota bacterium]
MRNPRNKKVAVALSGGVDSSVSAYLLKEQGFDVSGVFMRLWKEPCSKKRGRESEKRAGLVSKKLGIPFYVFNFEKEFKDKIVEYFLKEYKNYRTPNPCIICNKEIKFGLFLKKALEMGFDYIATGHYVKVRNKGSKSLLYRAKDKNKDQSYFLWKLTQKELKKTLFPIGDYNKKQVREIAKRNKLPVHSASESQEICFIYKEIDDFLRKHLKEKKGEIIDTNKRVLAFHKGLWFYTIGQRKGIGLSGGPYYVVFKDFKNNILIVSDKEKDLLKKELTAANVNWISSTEPNLPFEAKAKIRYRHNSTKAVISSKFKNRYKISFKRPQRAITSGQSIVFYKDNELLGGGIIA